MTNLWMPKIYFRNCAPQTHLMIRTIIETEDGSHTLYVPELEEHFHSTHGAIQESNHVFIKNGLLRCCKNEIKLLEVGFGTGLNALLTLINKGDKIIHYFSLEKYPLSINEYSQLNYPKLANGEWEQEFNLMHSCAWNKPVEIVPGFVLIKINEDLTTFDFNLPLMDLIYFDAFAPGKQPEMWEESILSKIASQTSDGGVFATYCAKGEVRRSLIRSGFNMQRIAGPPGKMEMLYGEKDH